MTKLRAALIRAGHTAAQTALGVIGSTALIEDVDWRVVLSTTALAAGVSLLKSAAFTPPEAEA